MGASNDKFHSMAGAAGGFTSGVVTCPLDVIKTKLQAQGGFRQQTASPSSFVYRGLAGTARVIWREDGIRGMYRGLGPTILGYLPTWAVYFTVYGRSKEYLRKFQGLSNVEYEEAYAYCSIGNENIMNVLCAVVAGGCSTMVTNPIWVIKTRLMSQVSRKSLSNDARPPWYYRSTLDAIRKMYTNEGVLSFYSGLAPALLGLTHVAVQFPAYEYLRKRFTGQGMGMSTQGDTSSHWFGSFSASVLSKVMASSATYPHEVIRTRLQTQQRIVLSNSSKYAALRDGLEGPSEGPATSIVKVAKSAIPRYKGVVTTFKTILREEGWRAFYAGMGTNMMRAVPASTTTLLTFEYVMQQFNHAKTEGQRKSAEAW